MGRIIANVPFVRRGILGKVRFVAGFGVAAIGATLLLTDAARLAGLPV